MRLKEGVSINGLRPELFFAALVAEGIWKSKGAPELVITSGRDGTHTRGSLHYVGLALDIRTYNLPGGYVGEAAHEAVEELEEALGNEFDVVLESNHVHIEFQPKR